MNGDRPSLDASAVLDAIRQDRQRVRRRVLKANAWFFPVMAALSAALVASPASSFGVIPVVVVAGVLIPLCSFFHRKHAGVSERIATGVSAVVVFAVLLALFVLGCFVASALSVRFDVEAVVPVFTGVAFVAVLGGGIALDAVGMSADRAR